MSNQKYYVVQYADMKKTSTGVLTFWKVVNTVTPVFYIGSLGGEYMFVPPYSTEYRPDKYKIMTFDQMVSHLNETTHICNSDDEREYLKWVLMI